MLEQIIVKTDCRKNFTCTWPGVGKVSIDENGEFSTEDKEGVEVLISHFSEFYIKGEKQRKDLTENVGKGNQIDITKLQDLSGELDDDDLEAIQNAELNKTEVNDIGQSLTEDEAKDALKKAEVELYKESLLTKSRKELEDLCKMFPGSEWRGKNKEALIAYLTEKLG